MPGHPAQRQYARQAVGGSRSGLFLEGDYIIFLKHDGGKLIGGHYDIRRTKGLLSEHAVWSASGRLLVSDSSALDRPEEVEFDPDDTSAIVCGVAIAVFRPIPPYT